jgi:hypothetical protein
MGDASVDAPAHTAQSLSMVPLGYIAGRDDDVDTESTYGHGDSGFYPHTGGLDSVEHDREREEWDMERPATAAVEALMYASAVGGPDLQWEEYEFEMDPDYDISLVPVVPVKEDVVGQGGEAPEVLAIAANGMNATASETVAAATAASAAAATQALQYHGHPADGPAPRKSTAVRMKVYTI